MLTDNHQTVVERFGATCQTDDRVIAAFLGGSYATGNADVYSDLDLYLITTDEAHVEFLDGKATFIRQLGDPLFLEDWGTAHGYFFILDDGTEGELWIGRESQFTQIHGGAFKVLLDKRGILSGVDFPNHEADPVEQIEKLRQLIMGFWHEVGHFSKALARGEIWFAYGSLEVMRNTCINLARLHHNFADADIGEEPYFKIEHAMPVEQLASLKNSYCPMEEGAICQAGQIVLQYYKKVATSLAQRHDIPYPVELERIMVARLNGEARQEA